MPRYFLFDKDGCYVLLADCWTEQVLSLVGSEIGRLMHTNKLTCTREWVTYARLLIEVDMDGKKVDTVPITLPMGAHVDLEVRFEAMPEFCKSCQHVGHSATNCWVVHKSGMGGQTQRGYSSSPAQVGATSGDMQSHAGRCDG